MRQILLLFLACLACTGQGRRPQTSLAQLETLTSAGRHAPTGSTGGGTTSNALASLLRALKPGAAFNFNPRAGALHSKPYWSHSAPAGSFGSQIVMQEPETKSKFSDEVPDEARRIKVLRDIERELALEENAEIIRESNPNRQAFKKRQADKDVNGVYPWSVALGGLVYGAGAYFLRDFNQYVVTGVQNSQEWLDEQNQYVQAYDRFYVPIATSLPMFALGVVSIAAIGQLVTSGALTYMWATGQVDPTKKSTNPYGEEITERYKRYWKFLTGDKSGR